MARLSVAGGYPHRQPSLVGNAAGFRQTWPVHANTIVLTMIYLGARFQRSKNPKFMRACVCENWLTKTDLLDFYLGAWQAPIGACHHQDLPLSMPAINQIIYLDRCHFRIMSIVQLCDESIL